MPDRPLFERFTIQGLSNSPSFARFRERQELASNRTAAAEENFDGRASNAKVTRSERQCGNDNSWSNFARVDRSRRAPRKDAESPASQK